MPAQPPYDNDRRPPRWVIPELDVAGEIDDHAAMCLEHAVEWAHASAAERILVDLRELTAIDAAGLESFVRHHADCRRRGAELALLICADARQAAIARAFAAAGLGEQLQFTRAAGSQPPRRRRARNVVRAGGERVHAGVRAAPAAWLRRLQRS